MFHLIVVEPFEGFAKGDRVSDPAVVAKILQSDNADSVIRVAAESAPVE